MTDRAQRPYLSAPDKAELPALTGVRALAALAVVGWHASGFLTAVRFPFTHGYLGVDLFFILSGFIISYVYWQDFEHLAGRAYPTFRRPAPGAAVSGACRGAAGVLRSAGDRGWRSATGWRPTAWGAKSWRSCCWSIIGAWSIGSGSTCRHGRSAPSSWPICCSRFTSTLFAPPALAPGAADRHRRCDGAVLVPAGGGVGMAGEHARRHRQYPRRVRIRRRRGAVPPVAGRRRSRHLPWTAIVLAAACGHRASRGAHAAAP